MRYALALAVLLACACERPVPDPDVPGHLKTAMAQFLNQSVGADSARVKFEVKDVSYFKDSTFYECEFKVRMVRPGKDTTGSMTARITRDFKNVSRKW
ncbi:MAG: hypothetical protein JST42_26915 [Bacteroidetes bacterium]|nr:hypothetical protein [Bacteroidota bacterium]